MMNFPDPYFRMVVVSIYLAAITEDVMTEEVYTVPEKIVQNSM